MVEFDVFRRALAASLLARAHGRRSCANDLVGDRVTVALCERLAADARDLDLHVFLIFRLMLTHRRLARRFAERNDGLLEQVGTCVRPPNATALLRWLIRRTLED